ncbi:exosortase C-terminal domain/associated protein EpsI [Methylophilus glucosoxydans]|uniref:Exosortase C-terminal domain/associated protein EpsI n=1 Tax=Methylophilus glucosoxydans TaxID=752553 RepID=A0ABW3GI21_9PROT
MLNRHVLICSIFLILSFLASIALRPDYEHVKDPIKIQTILPASFGHWQEIKTTRLQVAAFTDERGNTNGYGPYDQVVNKEYVNQDGQVVLLTLAWVGAQKQEVKVHRPDLCYPAQGFTVSELKDTDFGIRSLKNKSVTGKQMVASNNTYAEAVSYWIRIGDLYSSNPWKMRYHIFTEGLKGKVLDGILVRISTPLAPGKNAADLFKLNEAFASELISSISNTDYKRYLVE